MAKRGRNRRQLQQRGPQVPRQPDAAFALQVQGTHYSGPLPPPEVLAKFEAVLPGAAERIVAMAERNQQHRHKLESVVVPNNVRLERIGQIIAAIIYLSSLGCGTFLIYSGRDVSGLITILSITAAFAGLFVYSRRKKEDELDRKQ